jgi:hypothetical protein
MCDREPASEIETFLYDADGNRTEDESIAVRGEIVELDADGRVIATHAHDGLSWRVDPVSLDNAVAESFFASLEKGLLRRRSFTTRQDARTAVFDYIETFYNTIRLHSTLGYLSPIEYENIKLQERRAAA